MVQFDTLELVCVAGYCIHFSFTHNLIGWVTESGTSYSLVKYIISVNKREIVSDEILQNYVFLSYSYESIRDECIKL